MSRAYNIFCDESCHLENDQQSVMVLGAVWCPTDKVSESARKLREIKHRHHLSPDFEIKWTKVSPAKLDFYLDLLDYFFDDDDLHFRALVVSDKSKLCHRAFCQTHDSWYYKMLFEMLKVLLTPNDTFNIYLDIKDSRSADKVRMLHEVLCNNLYDFRREIIGKVQNVRSHEVQHVQLVDLLVGAVSYLNRGLAGNSAKIAFIEKMRQRSSYSLTKTTLLREDKVNLLIWEPAEVQT
ncbi:MAG: DUF3800 domain-containing protein [Armatimonadota bacterium]|jgi:hypothetical protein